MGLLETVRSIRFLQNFTCFQCVASNQFCANSIIIYMLVLAYVKSLKIRLRFKAFQRAGDSGSKLSVLSCEPLLSALLKENVLGMLIACIER